MKRILIIVIFILFLSIINLNCKPSEVSKFDYILNGNNIICYNTSIDKQEIEDFYYYYPLKIKQFYIDNNLTTRRIELERLIIILCKDSFNEWDNEQECKEKIQEDLKYKIANYLRSIRFSEHDNIAQALYHEHEIFPIIILKSYDHKLYKFFLLISEYNHHLIKRNALNNNISIYFDKIFLYWIDDGFTNFIGQYFEWFDYYTYLDKYDSYFENDIMTIEVENSKILFDMYKSKLYTNKSNLLFRFKDIFNKTPNDAFDGTPYARWIINTHKILFYSYLHYSRGTEKFYNYLNYLYNENYNSIDEIFYKCFDISFNDFLIEIDKELMK